MVTKILEQSSAARIEKAHDLMLPHLPPNTVLEIEETDQMLCSRYIMRLVYTSQRSGRRMNMVAKGDNLPEQDDATLRFYLMQLVLTPAEIGREFSRLYWLEKRARQDAWLSAGRTSRRKDGSGDEFSVVDKQLEADKLTYEDYI